MSIELIALRHATKAILAYRAEHPEATGQNDEAYAQLYLTFLENATPDTIREMFVIMQQQSQQTDMLMKISERAEFDRDHHESFAASWDSMNYK